ncbi:MAG: type II toxin-antitoxin system RelB/DinJ family antitoxin [Patescibacteria group bacterium]
MTTVNVRIDEKTKAEASEVLAGLGLDLSSAIKMFLRQVTTEQGIPFKPTRRSDKEIVAQWDREVEEALKNGKRYKNAEELFADLDND